MTMLSCIFKCRQCFKRTVSGMSWEVLTGSRRRKGRKRNPSWGVHLLVGEEQQHFLLSLGFCYLLVNVKCPVLALGRFGDRN